MRSQIGQAQHDRPARLSYPQRVHAVESDNDGPNGLERRSPSRIVLPVTRATRENRRRPQAATRVPERHVVSNRMCLRARSSGVRRVGSRRRLVAGAVYTPSPFCPWHPGDRSDSPRLVYELLDTHADSERLMLAVQGSGMARLPRLLFWTSSGSHAGSWPSTSMHSSGFGLLAVPRRGERRVPETGGISEAGNHVCAGATGSKAARTARLIALSNLRFHGRSISLPRPRRHPRNPARRADKMRLGAA